MWRRSRQARSLLPAAGAAALLLAWPGLGGAAPDERKPIPGGSIELRQRSPLSPVLLVHQRGRTTYVKLPPARRPGICDVQHWHVRWPFVTVVAQPAEDHGGRLDCRTDLDASVIWVVSFTTSISKPVVFSAGLDYPVGP